MNSKVYLIVTMWHYDRYGGGEGIMMDTMKWAHNMGMISFWISFIDKNNNNFNNIIIEKHTYGTTIAIPGGYSKKTLINWLKLLEPDIIHHQGSHRKEIYLCAKELRICFLSGIHFWNGIIKLDPGVFNKDILLNKGLHKIDEEFEFLYNEKECNLYCASEFVKKCINVLTDKNINDIIYPSSSYEKYKIKNNDITKNKYVTMINIHYLKGGYIFLYLLQQIHDIPFLGIRTEKGSDRLDKEIEGQIIANNKNSKLIQGTNDAKMIYGDTKILLVPSIVDETYCRCINEAMMNGIPILTSGKGYIKYFFKNSGIILPLDNKELWKNTLIKLYHDKDALIKESKKLLIDYNSHSEEVARNMFNNTINNIYKKSKNYNIMIIVPYYTTGLGIQGKNYAELFLESDFRPHIFSYKPYNKSVNKLDEICDVYHSENIREKISDEELVDFIYKYNIGKCVIPETCFDRIFDICLLLKQYGVKVYAIPNIEIVRRSEISKHHRFNKILCNNYLCYNIFKNYGFNNLEYINYGIKMIDKNDKKLDNTIKFLCIGGLNSISRKKVLEVCEAFSRCCKMYDNIKLTCTILGFNIYESSRINELNKYKNNKQINIIQDALSNEDILNLYLTHNYAIQVSVSEGLGINFFQSISTLTPVITLDSPPYNEIIIDNVNGFLVKCFYKDLIDNNEGLIQGTHFEVSDLENKLKYIIENKIDLVNSLIEDYYSRLDYSIFRKRFIDAIKN